MHNNNDKPATLTDIAAELNDVYVTLNELCDMLQGGGIVQVRDIEPTIASAVPKLQNAVETLNDASTADGGSRKSQRRGGDSQSPLLI